MDSGLSLGCCLGSGGRGVMHTWSPDSNRLSCLFSSGIAFGVELSHFIFNPVPHLSVDLLCVLPGCLDGRSDGNRNKARPFQEGFLWPALAGIVRYGYHYYASPGGQQGASHFIAAFFARRNACSFREKQGPPAFIQALLPQAHHLLERVLSLAAVDGNHAQ